MIEGEKIGNILPIAGQIFVVSAFQFDVAVFEFDEDERQAVDIEDEIGSPESVLSLNPQLADDGEIVLVAMAGGEIDQPHFIAGLSSIPREFDLDSIEDSHITFVVDRNHIECAFSGGEIGGDAIQNRSGDFGIQTPQRIPQDLRKNDLFFTASPAAVRKGFRFDGHAVDMRIPHLRLRQQPDDSLFNIVFRNDLRHTLYLNL